MYIYNVLRASDLFLISTSGLLSFAASLSLSLLLSHFLVRRVRTTYDVLVRRASRELAGLRARNWRRRRCRRIHTAAASAAAAAAVAERGAAGSSARRRRARVRVRRQDRRARGMLRVCALCSRRPRDSAAAAARMYVHTDTRVWLARKWASRESESAAGGGSPARTVAPLRPTLASSPDCGASASETATGRRSLRARKEGERGKSRKRAWERAVDAGARERRDGGG